MIDPDVAMAYLDFVPERHRVWEARQAGEPGPWTDDPILRTRKFTNIYRVLDYGSQFVLSDLADPIDDHYDVLARLFLYRYTNEPATWRHVKDVLWYYPGQNDLDDFGQITKKLRDSGQRVFSGAYVILPQPNRSGDKVDQAVELTKRWMANHATDFLMADTQEERFSILRSEYGVGPFLAMQILTDWGYTAQCGEDRENQFVVPGPGCIKGAKFIDPDAAPMDTLMWCLQQVHALPDCPTIQGRKPSLMDIQNTLCEFSKYHRFAAKPTPSRDYRPAHPGPQDPPLLPLHWQSS